jgi:predicted dinucleotide-binding enzyme
VRVGVIGSGRMGGALARHLVAAGHDVAIANTRGPESLTALTEGELRGRARAVTVPEAVQGSEVVFLAIPYNAVAEVAEQGAPWDGRIVVDLTNYYAERDGDELDPGAESSSVLVARQLDGAHVVKAFNTIWWRRVEGEGRLPGEAGRLAVPVAGDQNDAKQLVMALVDEIGFDPVDAGSLADGKRQEPGMPVYNEPLDVAGVRDALRASPG